MYPKEPSLITRPDFKRNNDTRPRPISFEIGSGYQAKKEPCCFHEEILKFRVDNVAKWIMLLSACLIKKLTFLSVSAFCSLFWAFLCSLKCSNSNLPACLHHRHFEIKQRALQCTMGRIKSLLPMSHRTLYQTSNRQQTYKYFSFNKFDTKSIKRFENQRKHF